MADRIYNNENAASPSDIVRMVDGYAGTVTVQVDGLSADTLTPQVTIDGSTWFTISGTDLSDGSAAASITADGVYRFDVTGCTQFRLSKAGTSDTVDAWARSLIG